MFFLYIFDFYKSVEGLAFGIIGLLCNENSDRFCDKTHSKYTICRGGNGGGKSSDKVSRVYNFRVGLWYWDAPGKGSNLVPLM